MISFVNAKLNLGLNILYKRPDGYHELSTLFYPVGLFNGTPGNPLPFCDILEIVPSAGGNIDYKFTFFGNNINCPEEKNLVVRATNAFDKALKDKGIRPIPMNIRLEKHIPDGAGLGGGSADAAFTLRMLNELNGTPLDRKELLDISLSLGADCPFFIINRPCIASGVGEVLREIEIDLSGYWAVIVKPDVYISTAKAFAGITPGLPYKKIEEITIEPVSEWRDRGLRNDFEKGIFDQYPILKEIKERLYLKGAVYASMSGSGSSLFGLFPSVDSASAASESFSEFSPSFITVAKL